MAVVIIERGPFKGTNLPLPPQAHIVVGREAICTLQVRDAMASRRHCAIGQSQDAFWVQDLHSSNGTFVNGERIEANTRYPLQPEDRVQVGETLLTVVTADSIQSLIGQTLAGYRIRERVGLGTIGTVYLAEQLSLERTVALRILNRSLASNRKQLDAFLDRAKRAGRINHPNIVPILDVGTERNLAFYAMDYMGGGSVADLVHDGPLEPALAVSIIQEAAIGLAHAHNLGLIHGRLQPGNLLRTSDGLTKVADLGISLPIATDGFDAFSAPELLAGYEPSEQTDIYSLGATLYFLLTGIPPFAASSPAELEEAICRTPPKPLPSTLAVPPALTTLLWQLLDKDPNARPTNAADVAEALGDGALVAELFPQTDSLHRQLPTWASVLAGFAIVAAIAVFAFGPSDLSETATQTQDTETMPAAVSPLARAAEQGRAALAKANAYVTQHPDDLAGAIERYRDIETQFSRHEALARTARQQRKRLEELQSRLAAANLEQQRREQESQSAYDDLQRTIESVEVAELQGCRAQLASFATEHRETPAAQGLPALERALSQRIATLLKQMETRLRTACGQRSYDRARTILATIDDQKLASAAEFNALKVYVDDHESAHRKQQQLQLLETRNREHGLVARAYDTDLRRAFSYSQLAERLAALPQLTDSSARQQLQQKLATVTAQGRLLTSLQTHVNTGQDPPVEIDIAPGVRGAAFEADNQTIAFRAIEQAGIEVRKSFARLDGEMFAQLCQPLNLTLEQRVIVAYCCLDLGDSRFAIELLNRIRPQSEPGLRARIDALVKEIASQP